MTSSDSAILEKIERPGHMLLGELQPCGGGDTIPLTRSKILVGRRSHCDICLKFSNVSSQHCELELKDGYWHVRDLGSRNGVKVNGIKVETKCIVPGDEVMIAKMAFKIDYSVDRDAPVPEDDSPFAISLMEKAGLATRPRNRMPKPADAPPKPKSAKPSRATRQDPRDIFLMEWFPE